MKLSHIIEKLETVKANHGDIDVLKAETLLPFDKIEINELSWHDQLCGRSHYCVIE